MESEVYDFDIDILVTNKQNFEKFKNVYGTIYGIANLEGLIV